jgi:tetratricopeptide (TPR) repeat protein
MFKEAAAKAKQIMDMDETYPQGYLQLGTAMLHLGQPQKAVDILQKLDYLMPDSAMAMYNLCFALVAAGRKDIALKVIDRMENLARESYVKSYFKAMAYVAVDDLNSAFAQFEIAFAERDPWLHWFGTEPKLQHLHSDPRFIELYKTMNNPMYQRIYSTRD